MTAAVTPLPNAAEAEARIRDRDAKQHAEEMHWRAVDRAKAIIDDPRGVIDAKLGTACVWYMRLSIGQGGGGAHYLRADAHLTAIRLREAQAREAQETSVKVAMRYRPHMMRIALGFGAAVIVAAAFHFLTH